MYITLMIIPTKRCSLYMSDNNLNIPIYLNVKVRSCGSRTNVMSGQISIQLVATDQEA